MSKKVLDLDQPRNTDGTLARKHGLRAIQTGHLTEWEIETLTELRQSFREQGFRDQLIESLAARTLLLDTYMTGEFFKRFSKGEGEIDSLYGRLTSSAATLARLVREIERREREGVITVSDLVEAEVKDVTD